MENLTLKKDLCRKFDNKMNSKTGISFHQEGAFTGFMSHNAKVLNARMGFGKLGGKIL
jgi:hypothetical protein